MSLTKMKVAKGFIQKLFYSFPAQLAVMLVKKNQLLLIYWLFLIGFVTSTVGNRFGIPYLFLDAEYMGEVGFLSFFITGLALGIFYMAFNITSYMLNSFRFPFLASLYKTFEKYSLNNSLIPALFFAIYLFAVIRFQMFYQLKPFYEAMLCVLGLVCGVWLVTYLTIKYFRYTNKDIYKLFGVASTEDESKSRRKISPIRNTELRKADRKIWRVDTYLVFPFKLKIVRSTSHYKSFMLESVFRQNHVNAAVLEMIIFVTFILLGLFRDHSIFRIPASASVLLLFAIVIMIAGVLRFWLRAWANTLIVGFFLLINFFSGYEVFNVKNKAYGLDYSKDASAYSFQSIENQLTVEQYNHDFINGKLVLQNWLAKFDTTKSKPPLVLLNVSGGGGRSALYTVKTLSVIDSVLKGKFFDHVHLICGSSGGMVGAAYYRELYSRSKDFASDLSFNREVYLQSISKDLLNATVFSFTVSDLLLNFQRFEYHNQSYLKDRAYAFEQQLNENTGYILDKKLDEYLLPELKAEIPRMIISPTIINDGRVLIISPLPSSYLLKSRSNSKFRYAVPDGVEMKAFFKEHNPGNLRFTTALRMNASFPYIMPAASLPSNPSIEVMDAGIRDNYGVLNSSRFLITFKDWINENTGGVIVVQIRDNNKNEHIEASSFKTISEKLLSPFKNITGNFLLMQDYKNDADMENLKSIFGNKINFVNFEMPQKEEKISLSWHLTEREKQYVIQQASNAENLLQLQHLHKLIDQK